MPNGNILVAHENQLIEVDRNEVSRKFAQVPDLYFSTWWLRWSPDSRALRFTAGTQGHSTIWEVLSDGTQLRDLFSGWHEGTDPLHGNWTPDGKYYLFQANRGLRSDIWAIREATDRFHKVNRQPVQVTAGPLSFFSPQPSVDGKRIFAIGVQLRSELVRYDAKSAQFVPYLGGSSITHVSFSRDGQWVTYLSYPEREVWRSRVDGTEKLQLTRAPLEAWEPTFSSDGRQILFNAPRVGGGAGMYLVSIDGGSIHTLAAEGGQGSWCGPDNSIVLMSGGGQNFKVQLFDARTSETTVVQGSDGLRQARCSPDGRYLAAVTQDGKKLRLYEFATEAWSDLSTRDIGFVAWSVDSKHIYFDTGSSKQLAIYRVRLADRKLERLIDLQNFRRVVDPWVSWMGLTPDGSPLLMRDIGSEEVYALDFEEP
jgi:Tol biopolymer transport system component